MVKNKQLHGAAKNKPVAAKAAPAKARARKTASKLNQRQVADIKAAGQKSGVGRRAASQETAKGKKRPSVSPKPVIKPKSAATAGAAKKPAARAKPGASARLKEIKVSAVGKKPPEKASAERIHAMPPAKSAAVGQAQGTVKSAAASVPAEPARQLPNEFDGFKVNDHVVYPTHGVGKIIAVEAQEIAGARLELFVISFEQEKMILRVPFGKAKAVGMRILSSRDTVRNALKTLRGRARVKRTMWSRRAQEYEAKINSGNLMLIAEVVRDLHRAEGQPEQSYSERQIYEAALERLAREVGAVEELDSGAALERVEGALKKAA